MGLENGDTRSRADLGECLGGGLRPKHRRTSGASGVSQAQREQGAARESREVPCLGLTLSLEQIPELS